MTHSTCTSQRVSQLSALLQNPATVLPVFTRFHQASKQLTIPVVDVVINGDSVEVKGEDGAGFAEVHGFQIGSRIEHFLHAGAAARAFVADHNDIARLHVFRQNS